MQPTRPFVASPPTANAQALDARRGQLLDWTLTGRIAVANGRNGGNGRIDWQQQAGRYSIALSAPVTRQSWRLTGDAQGARLEGVAGGPRASPDVEILLRDATGWEIPVGALASWLRGIGAASPAYGPTTVWYGIDGLPTRLVQAGWNVEYANWVAVTDGAQLPTRLEATNGKAKVRLVIDDWSLPAGPQP